MMVWLQWIVFSSILLYLVKRVIQTKSIQTFFIVLTGVAVMGCKMFIKELDSIVWQQIVAVTTLGLCLVSGWLIIKNKATF